MTEITSLNKTILETFPIFSHDILQQKMNFY